jgi:hypothetical protein
VKKKILLDSLKAREEITNDRNKTIIAAQDYVKALKKIRDKRVNNNYSCKRNQVIGFTV